MLNLIRKIFPRTKIEHRPVADLASAFLASPHHLWIANDNRIRKIFAEFLELLPQPIQEYFLNNQLLVLRANQKFSCSLDVPSNSKVVLIFPDFVERLRSVYYEEAMAILAHEMGHLYHQHSQQSIDPLEAQVAADAFAAELGYYKELVQIIEEEAQDIEAKVRLVYLNSKYMFKDGVIN